MALKTTIWDLDNCLADDRHRLPLIDWHLSGMARYRRYHDSCHEDLPANVKLFSDSLREHKPDMVVFMTGRPAWVREATDAWLKKFFGQMDFRYRLVMRDSDDERPSVQVKRSQLFRLAEHGIRAPDDIVVAYDDHAGIVQMYTELGINGVLLAVHAGDAYNPPLGVKVAEPVGVDQLLEQAAETYRSRNAQYKEGWKQFGAVMRDLHPEGVTLKTAHDFELFHLHILQVVKLVRFASSGLKHTDSVRDGIVYGGMIESSLTNNSQEENNE